MSDKYNVYENQNMSFLESTYQKLVEPRNKALEKEGATYYNVIDNKTVEENNRKKDLHALFNTEEFFTLNDNTPSNKWCGQSFSSGATVNTLEKPEDKIHRNESNHLKSTIHNIIKELDSPKSVELPDVDTSFAAYAESEKSSSTVEVTDGDSVIVKNSSGNYILYDSGKSYACISFLQEIEGEEHYGINISFKGEINRLNITNNSGSTIQLYKLKYATCSDSSSSVVIVYNSNNVAYNSFKININRKTYWYVCDETHNTWTDDLSEWGYSEEQPVPSMPTVTINDSWLVIGWSVAGNVTISANGTQDTKSYNDLEQLVFTVYDSTKVYAIVKAAKSPYVVVTRTGLQCESVNGTIGVRNVTSSSIQVYQAEYAYCDDSTASVVTVYDSSNNAFNAFKFTVNNTDYYYVLDGTQTDWTDDLSSIGYSETPITTTYYLSSYKYAESISNNAYISLRDSNGTIVEYDSTKTYTAYKYYVSSSDTTGVSDSRIIIGYLSGWTYLMLTNRTGSSIDIQRVDCIIS